MDLVVICTQATGERDKIKKKTIEWNGREKKRGTPQTKTRTMECKCECVMCVRRHFLRFIYVHLQAFNCMYLLVYNV